MTTDATHRQRGRPRTQGQAPRDVGAGRLPRRGHRLIAEPRPGPGRGRRGQPGRPGARRRRRLRQRRHPRGAAPAPTVVASRPHPRAVRDRRTARRRGAASSSTGARRDAEALPFADDEFDTVLSCVGVMFAPHHQASADELVRVCRPGRHHRPAQLDPGGVHRPDVRDDEAVRAAAAARRAAAAAVGQRGPRPGAARRPGHRCRGPRAVRHGRPVRDAGRASATTSRPTTARPSRSTGRSPTTPTKVAALDRELAELGRRFDRGTAGSSVLDWEYLLLTCERT